MSNQSVMSTEEQKWISQLSDSLAGVENSELPMFIPSRLRDLLQELLKRDEAVRSFSSRINELLQCIPPLRMKTTGEDTECSVEVTFHPAKPPVEEQEYGISSYRFNPMNRRWEYWSFLQKRWKPSLRYTPEHSQKDVEEGKNHLFSWNGSRNDPMEDKEE